MARALDMYDNQDFWIRQALAEIKSTKGVTASVSAKRKSLHKFGRSSNADSGVKTTVATFQDAVVNETFATTNSIDYVVSTAGDTGSLSVEGHTMDTDNGTLTFVVQTVTLTGTTPAQLATPLARCSRLYRTPGTYGASPADLTGNVTAYDSTLGGGGVTSGKPDVDTAVKCMITAGKQQTEKCATSLSSGDYWILTGARVSVARATGAGATADFEIEYREIGGVWLPLGLELTLDQAGMSTEVMHFTPHRWIPSNSDVRMVATSDLNDTVVTGRIFGVLAIQTG